MASTSTWPVVLTGRIAAGEIVMNRRRLMRALDGCPDGPVEITIDRLHATRSLKANAYYFGKVLKDMSEHSGYRVRELHEAMKQQFLPPECKELVFSDGHGVIRATAMLNGVTSRILNANEFYDFVEAVRQFAAETMELNIEDPDPNWRQQRDAESPEAAR